MSHWDFIVIGAGIAGASVACELATAGSVLLLERERQAGYHTTGRSAALYAPSYGNATVRALTRLSRSFYAWPPEGFTEVPLWRTRDVFFVATAEQRQQAKDFFAQVGDADPQIQWLEADRYYARVSLARPGLIDSAIQDSGTREFDVAAIHQGYLRCMQRAGGKLRLLATAGACRRSAGLWQVQTTAGIERAPVVVNAAGAWADTVAQCAGVSPLGLQPLRRTIIVVDAPSGVVISDWPMVVDIDEHFYFKPESGRILASPADEHLSPPCDAQPEELDIAIAVERLTQMLALEVRSIHSQWAGLRTFAPDRSPVVGFDPVQSGFFWLAGQGGFGIQTAPALASLAGALLTGQQMGEEFRAAGFTEQALSPGRDFSLATVSQ